MEPPFPLEDSCDFEMKLMKKQLIEYGLEEDNLSKQEMSDLLKALINSKKTIKQDEILRHVVDGTSCSNTPKERMKRRYFNVRDRRMPWSLFPRALTQAEKAQTLAVYIKLMSINNYRQARQSSVFAAWAPPIQIVEESTRVQPIRSTRSGRSMPIYADFDDDSSDLDFVLTQSKKRKVSNSDQNSNDGVYPNKVVSLKRKSSKDENMRPMKEAKIIDNDNLVKDIQTISNEKFSLIED